MSEIANGYSWYKFDIDGWLNSADVQQMDFTERGVYHHLLTVQARDGKLAADILAMSRQAGMDKRTLNNWLVEWGFLFPIIDLSSDVLVTPPQRESCVHVTSMQRECSVCVAKPLPLRCFPAASWMRQCSARANPKQWNLSVKSGKFEGQPLLEESRGEGYTEGDTEPDQRAVRLTMKAFIPVAKGQGV